MKLLSTYHYTAAAIAGGLFAILTFGPIEPMIGAIISAACLAFLLEYAFAPQEEPWHQEERLGWSALAHGLMVALCAGIAAWDLENSEWMGSMGISAISHLIGFILVLRAALRGIEPKLERHFDGEHFYCELGTGSKVYWCPECNHLMELFPPSNASCDHCGVVYDQPLPDFKGVPSEHRSKLERMSPPRIKPGKARVRLLP